MDKLFRKFDEYPAIPIGMLVGLLVVAIVLRRGKRRAQMAETGIGNFAHAALAAARRTVREGLDEVLFWWTRGEPYRIRDLLANLLILGRTGSAKTTSSGKMIGQAIVSHPRSGGLVLLPKPEDLEMWTGIFRKAGRLKDLLVFDAEGSLRCNFLGCLKRPRDVVQFLMTLSEVMKRGDAKGGGDNSRFYDAQEERTIYNAVAALQAAGEPLTAPNLHRFIMTAAREPAELTSPEWEGKYHNRVLKRGFQRPKAPLEAHDFELCLDFWLKEWAGMMDVKTRGNILAGVQGTLHVMNTGLVREMCSGETNCSPLDVLNGKWVCVNFPPTSYGATGVLISVGWKQLVELAILERHATDKDPFCVIWCDEAHAVTTAFDAVSFIPQCRSHKGALVFLAQGISSFHSAMKGENGRHEAENLLGQFSTVIAHACDPVSAKWLSSKLGRRKEILYGGSTSRPHDATAYDMLFGNTGFSGSFNEHYEPPLQDQEFMVGRTGGPANGFLADAVVIKSGEPFADGKSYQRVVFSQKG